MAVLDSADIDRVVVAAGGLDLTPRDARWCHLSLCVIDATFSIGARYGSTWRAARRYAEHAGLEPVTAPAVEVAAGRYAEAEEPLSVFVAGAESLSDVEFARIVGNRQRTSSRGGITKAAAVQKYARVLLEHGIERLCDVAALLEDVGRTGEVEAALAAVPGHGSGVRVSYLWMLAGDDRHVKADRMVVGWLGRVLGRRVGVAEATALTIAAADRSCVTPWELDHAIWVRQRRRA